VIERTCDICNSPAAVDNLDATVFECGRVDERGFDGHRTDTWTTVACPGDDEYEHDWHNDDEP